ncbi:MAG TPA: flagellar basal body P-ring formation chaperone FlgA [Pirellulales bacterium]|nr:flagellar basal body P-ring formation chaperone FlgA [Pirellulales bacterium]
MKRIANLLTACGLGLACLFAVSASVRAAELQLRPEIHTQKNLLQLGDVAEIFTASSPEAAMLSAIELMPAPSPGTRVSIRLREIQDILSMRGVNLANVQFTGAAQVMVIAGADPAEKYRMRRPAKVLIQRAERIATDAIVRHLQSKAGAAEEWQVSVTLEDDQVAPLVAAGDAVKVVGGQEPWTGTQSFEFRLPSAEGQARMEISAQVSLPPTVVITLHAMPKGTIVRTSDVELRRLRAGVSPGELFQSIDDVAGKEAIRNIPAGQPLDANLVHPPLLVRSGEVVTVFGRNGSIVVRMPARARENGSEGDLVSVESLLDRQTFLARVSGLHEVEVFAGATTTAPASSGRQSTATRTTLN